MNKNFLKMRLLCGALVMMVFVIVHTCHTNVSQKPKTQTAKVIIAGLNPPLCNIVQYIALCNILL